MNSITKIIKLACVALISLSVLTAAAADKEKKAGSPDLSKLPPASDKKGVTYATDIKPMFDKTCIKCHGTDKQKGGLRLDSLDNALKGGDDGKVIKPGDSAHSMLVHNIAHIGDEDDYMPPPDKKELAPLTKEQIGLVRAWIDQGAK